MGRSRADKLVGLLAKALAAYTSLVGGKNARGARGSKDVAAWRLQDIAALFVALEALRIDTKGGRAAGVGCLFSSDMHGSARLRWDCKFWGGNSRLSMKPVGNHALAIETPPGAHKLWVSLHPLLEACTVPAGHDELVALIVLLCRLGRHDNRALLDTKLLPALEPALKAAAAPAVQVTAAVSTPPLAAVAPDVAAMPGTHPHASPVRLPQTQQQPQQQHVQQQQQVHSAPPRPLLGEQQPQRFGPMQQPGPSPITPGNLTQLLPAMAAFGLQPRKGWWQLYQAALAPIVPSLDTAPLARVLQAAADLHLSLEPAFYTLTAQRLTPESAASLAPVAQATLLIALGRLTGSAPAQCSNALAVATVQALWCGSRRQLPDIGQQEQMRRKDRTSSSSAAGSMSGSSENGAADSVVIGSNTAAMDAGCSTQPPTAAGLACDLLSAAGQLQRRRHDLGPPSDVVDTLLAISNRALAAGEVPPASIRRLAVGVQVLGAKPSTEWLDRCAGMMRLWVGV